MDVLRRCGRMMSRYMSGVSWQDWRSSSEVVEMYGVKDLFAKLRQRRLRWFGHVKRAEGGVLGEVGEVRAGRRRLAGRPRKKWSECVVEDKNWYWEWRSMWCRISHPNSS